MTDAAMIEAVAKAIFAADWEVDADDYEKAEEYEKEHCRIVAKAAIEALRAYGAKER